NPGYDGSIPRGSHSVRITLTDPASGDSLSPARVVSDTERPDGITGSITVGFPLLRVGPVKVDVTAHPDLVAQGTPLATGSVTSSISANTTTSTSVQMVLTLNRIVVAPPSQTLNTAVTPF